MTPEQAQVELDRALRRRPKLKAQAEWARQHDKRNAAELERQLRLTDGLIDDLENQLKQPQQKRL